MTDTRVVVINGARQTGKSALARLVMDGIPGAELRYLDEAVVRSAAQVDPALFVRHDGLLVLDEVQRVPDLPAIKHEVDVDPRPGGRSHRCTARTTSNGHCGVAIPRPYAAPTLVDARASSSPTCQI